MWDQTKPLYRRLYYKMEEDLLRKIQEEKIDILGVFGINIDEFYQPLEEFYFAGLEEIDHQKLHKETGNFLKRIEEEFQYLRSNLNSGSTEEFPLQIQEEGKELKEQITTIYQLLVEQENYIPRLSAEGNYTAPIIEYIAKVRRSEERKVPKIVGETRIFLLKKQWIENILESYREKFHEQEARHRKELEEHDQLADAMEVEITELKANMVEEKAEGIPHQETLPHILEEIEKSFLRNEKRYEHILDTQRRFLQMYKKASEGADKQIGVLRKQLETSQENNRQTEAKRQDLQRKLSEVQGEFLENEVATQHALAQLEAKVGKYQRDLRAAEEEAEEFSRKIAEDRDKVFQAELTSRILTEQKERYKQKREELDESERQNLKLREEIADLKKVLGETHTSLLGDTAKRQHHLTQEKEKVEDELRQLQNETRRREESLRRQLEKAEQSATENSRNYENARRENEHLQRELDKYSKQGGLEELQRLRKQERDLLEYQRFGSIEDIQKLGQDFEDLEKEYDDFADHVLKLRREAEEHKQSFMQRERELHELKIMNTLLTSLRKERLGSLDEIPRIDVEYDEDVNRGIDELEKLLDDYERRK